MFLCNDAEKLPGTFEVVLECFMQSHTQQLHIHVWLVGSLVVILAMLDVQNFFLEALAVIFVKVQYLYFRSKLSVSSIRWYQFKVAHYELYSQDR